MLFDTLTEENVRFELEITESEDSEELIKIRLYVVGDFKDPFNVSIRHLAYESEDWQSRVDAMEIAAGCMSGVKQKLKEEADSSRYIT